jgi:hypothetical protein
MFNYDETMFAANLSRSKVIVALDQGVFRKKHEKPHHIALGAVFDPLGHGRDRNTVRGFAGWIAGWIAGSAGNARKFRMNWRRVVQ